MCWSLCSCSSPEAGTILMAMERMENAPGMRSTTMPRLNPCTATPLILPAALVTHCRKAAGVQEGEKERQNILDIGATSVTQKVPHVQGSCWKGCDWRGKGKGLHHPWVMWRWMGWTLLVMQEGESLERKGLFIHFLFYLEVQHSAQSASRGGKPGWWKALRARLGGASEATWFVQLGEELRGASPQSAASSVEGELLASYRTGWSCARGSSGKEKLFQGSQTLGQALTAPGPSEFKEHLEDALSPWVSVRQSCKEQGLTSMALVSFPILFYGIVLPSAASKVGEQFSIRIVFQATFCWKRLISWYEMLCGKTSVPSKPTAEARHLPGLLACAQLAALWDSWDPALQPAAHLIFLYSIVVLFILHFPPYIFIFIFYIQFSYSIKRSPVAHQNIRCQIKVQVTQWE